MPWLLEIFHGWKVNAGNSLYAMYSSDQGYVYENSNSYPFCPKKLQYSYGDEPYSHHNKRSAFTASHTASSESAVSQEL